MTFDDFHSSLQGDVPPAELSPALLALWHDGNDNWDTAHDALQNDATPDGAWVHAYLHRKEGDASNAAYWYRRAGKPNASGELRAEWAILVSRLL